MNIIRQIYDWMGTKVGTRYALVWLVILFFIEASFLVVPIDPLLILYCLNKRSQALFYAGVATAASVLGGIFGYIIGAFVWSTLGQFLVDHIIGQAVFESVLYKYELYQYWVVLIAAFTPIPYKAITLSAGFCRLDLIPFILISLIGRGARFFLIGGMIYVWGDPIKRFIDKYFDYLVVVFTLIILTSVYILIH